eukprot:tig00001029_g6405.t1
MPVKAKGKGKAKSKARAAAEDADPEAEGALDAPEAVAEPEAAKAPDARVDMKMLIRRCLSAEEVARSRSADDLAAALLKVTHIRLDRESIVGIENLEALTQVTNIYLQHNRISRIENMEFHPNLRFLALSHNRIQELSGLRILKNLEFLDLSNNDIKYVKTDELPRSLRFLLLHDNPCTLDIDYRPRLAASLPHLQALDEVRIYRSERMAAIQEFPGLCDMAELTDDEDLQQVSDDEEDEADEGDMYAHEDDENAREETWSSGIPFNSPGEMHEESVAQLAAEIEKLHGTRDRILARLKARSLDAESRK